MDANGLRFWSLADEQHWQPLPPNALRYDRERLTLELGSFRELALEEPEADPTDLLAITPQAVDAHETYAYAASGGRVFASGALPGQQEIAVFPGSAPSDLALGHDGILYLAVDGALLLRDPRQRWPEHRLEAADLTAFRLAALPGGGVLILDRGRRRIWRSHGQPFPQRGLRRFDGDVFRPDEENPDPPRLTPFAELGVDDGDPIAIATSSQGQTVILCWGADRSAHVRRLGPDAGLGPRVRLAGVARPFSAGWLDAGTLAFLVRVELETPGGPLTRVEVVPYPLPGADEVQVSPLGGFYPLVQYTEGPLSHVLREPVRYPSFTPAPADTPPERRVLADRPRPIVRLSKPELARSGSTEPLRLDSGRLGTTWHRLYLEASIPPECGVRVWLAASESAVLPAGAAFFEHAFGDVDSPAGVPRGVWSSSPSELPFHPGLLACPPRPHRAGLFGVLVQRAGRLVSALAGRYLHVRVELSGNGRSTPELAALRVYGGRFSYVDQYLPRLYREQVFAPEADAVAERSTPADFLERFLCNFEGILTPLEDRIANAHLLTDPESAPEEALEWLGQWIGFVFDPAYPPAQRRRALKSAAELHRWHGTLRGLTLALDIATGGALARGEVVVVEDYRLRRTFATILGADLADEEDPLTAGIVDSGNSIVGDTLVLGNEFQREFLSVFREVLPERPRGSSVEEWVSYIYQRFVDPHVVDDFFDRFAHRLTVLVQKEVSDEQVRLIQRVLELEAPAHVQAQVLRASQPFIVGLASLVGVDTFLRDPAPLPDTRVDEARIGTTFLLRAASLDPRLEVSA